VKALFSIDSIAPTQNEIESLTVNIPYSYTDAEGKSISANYVCTGSQIWSYFDFEYSMFQFPARVDSEIPAKETLYRMWDIYVENDVLVNLPRILTAFMSEYNPLENYNGVETTEGVGSSRNHTAGKVKTKTDISNSNEEDGETKHYETTYDNLSDSQLRYKDTVSAPKTKTSGEADSNYTDYGEIEADAKGVIKLDDNHLINATDATNSQTVTRHGNLGVTTSQQMIEAEMALRKFNIVKYIVDRFANLYLTLSR